MGKIYYSLSGEGRGHATRAKTLVDRLRLNHQVTIFAPHAAFDFLSGCYVDGNVNVLRIPGLEFHYRNQRLSFIDTTLQGVNFLRELGHSVQSVRSLMEQDPPDLVITDFEPILPRAAESLGIPYLSVDHQNFLVVSDLSCLPLELRLKASAMSLIVRGFYHRQRESIVSSFYFPPLKPHQSNVVQTGVLLRDSIVQTQPENLGHVLVYLRRFAPPALLSALSECGRPVIIYGLGERPSEGRLQYRPIGDAEFTSDLATCEVLVSNAGNQLVGEALFLGKPVLVLPESRNFEQQINARFLAASGGGEWMSLDQIDDTSIRLFLSKADQFRSAVNRNQINGNDPALEAIQRHLPAVVPLPQLQPHHDLGNRFIDRERISA